jgi:DNA-directed RNA polymerase subunit beta'
MGRLVPAGTGVSKYRGAKLLIEEPEELPEPPEEEIFEDYVEEVEVSETEVLPLE